MNPNKKKIALLFSQLSLFQPERNANGEWTGKFLVNYSKVQDRKASNEYKQGSVACPPDRDDLLHMIGEASIELTEFMRGYDDLLNTAASNTAGFMQASDRINTLLGSNDTHDPFLTKLETLAQRYVQMADLIESIAHRFTGDQAKDLARKFLSFKPERFSTLVNQTDAQQETNQSQVDAGSGQPVFACEVCGQTGAFGLRGQFDFICPACGGPTSARTGEPIPPDTKSQG